VKTRVAVLEEKGGPFASRVPPLLRHEFFLSAWLWETGAKQTAELLLSDMIELAIFVGSEKGRGDERVQTYGLSTILVLPLAVRGTPAGSEPLIEIGAAAQAAVREEYGTVSQDLIEGSRLNLDALHAEWASAQHLPSFLDPPDFRSGAGRDSGACAVCSWYLVAGPLRHGPTAAVDR